MQNPQPEGPPVPIHALPTHLQINSAVMPTATRGPQLHLAFEFSTPQGVNVFFIDAAQAEHLASVIKAKASGLVLPGMN